MKFWILIVLYFSLNCFAIAQDSTRIFINTPIESSKLFIDTTQKSKINLIIEAGLAYNINMTEELNIEGVEYDNRGIGLFLRTMLQSEHFLSIGIESGYFPIKNINNKQINSEYGTTNVKSNLDAIPILLVFGMDFDYLKIYYGLGYYYLISRISAFDELSHGNDFSLGFMISAEYNWLKYKNLSSGLYLKLYQISDASRSILNIGLSIQYKL